ncbi:hypothetical protein BGZ99_006835, partial [Dissophora globulifera]
GMLENDVLFVGYRCAQDMLHELVATPDDLNTKGAELVPFSVPMLCLSGATSSVFASVVLTPVELVKCKLQVQQIRHLSTKKPANSGSVPKALYSEPLGMIKHIYTQNRVRGFYRGHMPIFLHETGGGAAWFGSYEAIRHLLVQHEQSKAPKDVTVT